jgi:hypothetical protein
MRADGGGHRRGEAFAVDRQRSARRHRVRIGAAHDQRAKPAHLFFSRPTAVSTELLRKELEQTNSASCSDWCALGAAQRPHLDQVDVDPGVRRDPRGLAPGEPAADDGQPAAHASSGSAIVSL